MSLPVPDPENPDVNRFLPASLAPECRMCRALASCGGVLEDCPYRDPDPEAD